MNEPTIAEIAKKTAEQIEIELDPCLIGNEIEGLIRIITRAIERATAALQKTNDSLRRDLADPPADVQELVIKRLNLVSWERCNQLREQNAALVSERQQTRENLYAGLDRDRDDITTPHLATVATNALITARQRVGQLDDIMRSMEQAVSRPTHSPQH